MTATPPIAMTAADDALKAIRTLRADLATCGTQRRQRFLINRIRASLETIDFLIGYESVEREQGAAA